MRQSRYPRLYSSLRSYTNLNHASVVLDTSSINISGSGELCVSPLVVDLAAWTSFLTHPLYWAIWTYIFPQPGESLALRLSASAVSVPLLLRGYWPPSWQGFLRVYWYWFVVFVVPFIFTYLLLANDFSTVWLVCHMGMAFLLILLLPRLRSFASALLVGTTLGTLLFVLMGGEIDPLSFPQWYIAPIGFVLVFCFAFMHQARVGAARIVARVASEQERSRMLRALTGTIAHEIRKPVAQSKQSLALMEAQLTQIEQALRARRPDEALEMVRRAQAVTERGYSGMVRGDMLIGIILRNIREERIDPSDFQVLSIASIVDSALESYAFGRGQRERVRVVQAEDFSVRGEENLLIYVLFNLLQNALVFDAGRPDLAIEVRFGRDGDGGWLSVRDNGPGIPAERLPGIFESFMTYANKQGTGLGLPFCKRVMTALGGRIDVRSAPGAGTEFRLRFPPVTASAPRSAAGTVSSRA